MESNFIKGRGAQLNTANRFLEQSYSYEDMDGIDEPPELNQATSYYFDTPKKVVNKVESTDVGMYYSLNPYQGCEHGCIYCYARNTHEYWGFNAGMDFEQKIIVKSDAAKVLRQQLLHPKWEVRPIVLSGNTDCYQPAERKFEITRKLLETLLEFKHPVSIITKNSLLLRDLEILKALQEDQLISVNISITTLDEAVRRKLEPRTASSEQRLKVVKVLSDAGIPVNVMVAPIIPGLNSHEIPEILKKVAGAGARSAAYTMVRLNGTIGSIFTDWLLKAFPHESTKILRQIKECHNGKLNDSRLGLRMRGEGVVADQVNTIFRIAKNKYMQGRTMPSLNCQLFKRKESAQLRLW